MQMENRTIEERKEDLRSLLAHLKIASEMAKIQVPDGTVGLAIIARKSDGTGQITAAFEAEQFFIDLEAVLGPGDGEEDKKDPV